MVIQLDDSVQALGQLPHCNFLSLDSSESAKISRPGSQLVQTVSSMLSISPDGGLLFVGRSDTKTSLFELTH